MSTVELELLLEARYEMPEWVTIRELSGAVGSRGYDRRADLVAFNCWPSKDNVRLAFECKRTRADFMREIDAPEKRGWLEAHFHQCYFVVAAGIVKPDEVPEGWGLLVATKGGDKLIRRKAAQHRDAGELPEFLALSAIRRLAKTLQKKGGEKYTLDGIDITRDDLEAKVDELLALKEDQLEARRTGLRQRKQQLIDERARLEAPLRALAEMAGDRGTFSPWPGSDPPEVTPEQVKEWVVGARQRAIRGVMGQVWEAHRKLGALIGAARAADLDAGEPEKYERSRRKQEEFRWDAS